MRLARPAAAPACAGAVAHIYPNFFLPILLNTQHTFPLNISFYERRCPREVQWRWDADWRRTVHGVVAGGAVHERSRFGGRVLGGHSLDGAVGYGLWPRLDDALPGSSLAGFLCRSFRRRRDKSVWLKTVVVALAVGLIGTLAMAGHAVGASGSEGFIHPAADALHLVAAAAGWHPPSARAAAWGIRT